MENGAGYLSTEDKEVITTVIDIEEHPVKMEDEEETDTLICDSPAPDTEVSDQEQPYDVGEFNTAGYL
jgi:hypothetical protein